jgi:hypothetical protein
VTELDWWRRGLNGGVDDASLPPDRLLKQLRHLTVILMVELHLLVLV